MTCTNGFMAPNTALPTLKHSSTLEDNDSIMVKVRGPKGYEKECFFFFEEILGSIDQVFLNYVFFLFI